jgi:hypothetical protein
MPVPNWPHLTRFERACWYWRCTNEVIAPHATTRVRFESMVSDLEYLSRQLEQIGIILHPLLAEQVFHTRVNASHNTDVPPHDQWGERYRRSFASICGSMQKTLGYPNGAETGDTNGEPPLRRPARAPSGRILIDFNFAAVPRPMVSAFHVRTEQQPDGLLLRPAPASADIRNIVVLLTAGTWNHVAPEHGVSCGADVYYHCAVEAAAGEKMRARLFVLFYDASGALIRRFQAGTIRAGESKRAFSFAPAVDATHLALALHLGGSASSGASAGDDETLLLKRVQLETLPMDRGYAATPAAEAVGTSGRSS